MPRPRPPHLRHETTRHDKRVWYVRIHSQRIRLRADYGLDVAFIGYTSAAGKHFQTGYRVGRTQPLCGENAGNHRGWPGPSRQDAIPGAAFSRRHARSIRVGAGSAIRQIQSRGRSQNTHCSNRAKDFRSGPRKTSQPSRRDGLSARRSEYGFRCCSIRVLGGVMRCDLVASMCAME
jgi:hypothetical protein